MVEVDQYAVSAGFDFVDPNHFCLEVRTCGDWRLGNAGSLSGYFSDLFAHGFEFFFLSVIKQSVGAYAHKAFWQDVLQEAAQELLFLYDETLTNLLSHPLHAGAIIAYPT